MSKYLITVTQRADRSLTMTLAADSAYAAEELAMSLIDDILGEADALGKWSDYESNDPVVAEVREVK